MLGLDMLDVAIGVVFVYLLLSLIASAAAEAWEAVFKMRAAYLERGIKELLRNSDLVAKVYRHPLINGLYQGNYGEKKAALPSYIPTRSFALAIMDILLPAAKGATPPATPLGTTAAVDRAKVDLSDLKMDATAKEPATIPPPAKAPDDSSDFYIDQAKHALQTLVNAAGGDAEQARKNIEDWFNASMDRVSGWYKRRTQLILFVVGLIISIALNVDSIHVVSALSTDKPKRESIVGIATAYSKENQPTKPDAAPKTDTVAPKTDSAAPTKDSGVLKTGTTAPKTETTQPKTETAQPKTDTTTTETPSVAHAKEQTQAALTELNKLGLPIGWKNYGCALCEEGSNNAECTIAKSSSDQKGGNRGQTSEWLLQIPKKLAYPHWVRCWLLVFVGWLMTALAVSLGAPFWFDTLNKLIVVRSTVKPQEKSGTESSKDPQKK
jgi:hypothetical protein